MSRRRKPPEATERPETPSDLFGGAPEPAEPERAKPEPIEPGPAEPEAAMRKDKDHREGHRARLRRRFLGGGARALADYELMELVLFRAIGRRDVKPLAKELLKRFGGFAGAISADPERLREIEGLGDAAIAEMKIIEAAAQELARGKVMNREVMSGWEQVIDYCRATMSHRATEQFRVLFLDRKNRLIADEEFGRGTVDRAPVYPREVAKRALELQASALILAHNHPSGDPAPSKSDIAVTAEIVAAAKAVGVAVHDHVVIGKGRDASFRALGLL